MKRWLKTYFLTAVVMYIGGTIRSIIGGYRYFCDGWQSCDNKGNVIGIDDFISREVDALLLILIGSIIITFFVLRIIDQTRKDREEKDSKSS